MHSVLLVEDQKPMRERIARVINGHPQLTLLAAVGDCAAAREQLQLNRPAVLLTDLGLPDGDGITLIRETRASHPDTEIMVITVFGDERHVLGAIEAGATGYLLKDGTANYIGHSIMQLLAGGAPISASIARHLLRRFQKPENIEPAALEADAPQLTEREHEVLRLVAKGFSYAEIAAVLTLSTHTVTTHVKQIYRKMAVHSRGEAVFEAVRRGLIRWDGP